MKKERIDIDLTIGKRQFDISKQDEWTKEEWAAFLDTSDDTGFYFNLLDDETLFLQFKEMYLMEPEKKLYVLFDIINKFDYNILIKFGSEIEDDKILGSLRIPSIIIEKDELKENVLGYVQLGKLKYSLFMEVKIFNEAGTKIVRDLGFNVKFFHEF
ncbi:hypothetical protein CSE16_08225 [Solibacillus sp. R5-41]|uniref:hypothetical protein n=1 Tax=Solibacillus sp. R5-41 TaxID=2048654 RepID=UPI000C12674B|nr:hypothetical protein [Solibacillus sp. R5-41]ATP40034.1 hypothetical protein CSE16_08225 [Solibacillus sp. R5-41]